MQRHFFKKNGTLLPKHIPHEWKTKHDAQDFNASDAKMQSPKMLMGQSKEFKQNWTGLKNFYTCFFIFLVMTKLFFLEGTMGTRLTSI